MTITHRRSRRAGRSLVFGVVALALGACGGGRADVVSPFEEGGRSSSLTFVINNNQLEEARFWVWIDGSRRRLGSVRGNSTRTLRTSIARDARVRLEFDITLGARCFTRTVSLQPGDQLDFTIPTNLRFLRASCR